MSKQMTNATNSRYQCIGGCMGNTAHHVEAKYAGTMGDPMWIIPGTYRDDPAFAQAGAMAHYARSHRTNYWLRGYPWTALRPS